MSVAEPRQMLEWGNGSNGGSCAVGNRTTSWGIAFLKVKVTCCPSCCLLEVARKSTEVHRDAPEVHWPNASTTVHFPSFAVRRLPVSPGSYRDDFRIEIRRKYGELLFEPATEPLFVAGLTKLNAYLL